MRTIREITKKDGSVMHHAEIRLRGHPPQRQSFRTKTQAKKWIQDTEAAIGDGRYKGLSAARKHTVGELIDRLYRTVQTAASYLLSQKGPVIVAVETRIGVNAFTRPLPFVDSRSAGQIIIWNNDKKTIRCPGTVNRYLALFSRALSVASKEWEWMDDNPMQKVRKLKESKGRDRCLSASEKEPLLKACRESKNPFLYHIVNLALLTGMRYGEIVKLRWEDINFELRYATMQQTKNGDKRVIPITEEIIQVLKFPKFPCNIAYRKIIKELWIY